MNAVAVFFHLEWDCVFNPLRMAWTVGLSGTVGHEDLYAYQDLTGTPAAIMAVQLATVARKDDAGSRSLRAVLKSGATTANGATRVLGTSYALYDDRFEVDPATGAAWTKAGVDALEAGWRWWRDGRAGQPGCGRGAAAVSPERQVEPADDGVAAPPGAAWPARSAGGGDPASTALAGGATMTQPVMILCVSA